MGSVQLLECRQTPGWSPTHFLRSDPHYHRWEFIRALTDAAGEGSSEEVKWLLAHFPACEAPWTVLDAAAMNGHLEVLQLLEPYFVYTGGDKTQPKKKRKVITSDGYIKSEGANVIYFEDEELVSVT
ncbi:hypothetical protein PI124_g15789 [Phytophthora idaei]|nr:hypothetical protein PI125_g10060 [Phytophthora idaei]KAG3143020.1 hypothetical protein PI126_g14798 [Phytophthora idaei]KAG3239273.1 hypothetical protein PI124_g15789 [Phytophthora idaei]